MRHLVDMESLRLQPRGELVDVILTDTKSRAELLRRQPLAIGRGSNLLLLLQKILQVLLLLLARLQYQHHAVQRSGWSDTSKVDRRFQLRGSIVHLHQFGSSNILGDTICNDLRRSGLGRDNTRRDDNDPDRDPDGDGGRDAGRDGKQATQFHAIPVS